MKLKLFHRNFSLLIAGQASSLLGNGILDFAMSMYVLDKTGSAAVYAGFLTASMIPSILFSPLGGILADRGNKRNIMAGLDFLAGLGVLLVAVFMREENSLAMICGLLLFESVLGAFETPAVQSCIPFMQKGENLVRANAVVIQINALSAFFSPILGSLVYTAFGLKPVLYAGVVCFFFTACFECFIEIPGPKYEKQGRENPLLLVKEDFLDSLRLITRERPAILKMLLVISVVTCLLQGVSAVGFPYIIRNVLGLSSIYYGFSESAVGLAAIAGGILAGLAASKIHGKNIYLIIGALGFFLIPPGILFLLSGNPYIRYGTLVLFSVLLQLAACGFSIFATSLIQRLTPGNMMGKVSAYTSAFTQCIQPLGQILYGFLFDSFSGGVAWILILTGTILGGFALAVKGFFRKTERESKPLKALLRDYEWFFVCSKKLYGIIIPKSEP